jgi:hypothetical protein
MATQKLFPLLGGRDLFALAVAKQICSGGRLTKLRAGMDYSFSSVLILAVLEQLLCILCMCYV